MKCPLIDEWINIYIYMQCYSVIKNMKFWDFPGGTVVKNPPANVGDTGLSPGLGRSHMSRSN